MLKPCNHKLRKFAARIQELNNLLLQFLGSDYPKKTPQEELKKIPIHSIPNGRTKHLMMLSFYFESGTFHSALELFELMEVSKDTYKGAAPPYNNKYLGVDSNHDSGGNKKGGESASPICSTKRCTGKCKSNNADHLKRNKPHTTFCMIHGVDHSSKEYRVLRDYVVKCHHQ